MTADFDPGAYYLHIGDKPVVGPKNGYSEKDIGMINKTVKDTEDPDYVKAGEYNFPGLSLQKLKEISEDYKNPQYKNFDWDLFWERYEKIHDLKSPLGEEGEEQWIQR